MIEYFKKVFSFYFITYHTWNKIAIGICKTIPILYWNAYMKSELWSQMKFYIQGKVRSLSQDFHFLLTVTD